MPAVVDFPDHAQAPSRRIAAVTPNDAADLPGGVAKQLLVTVAGSLVLAAVDDTASTTLPSVAVGALLPIRARRVYATGTTASVVALF